VREVRADDTFRERCASDLGCRRDDERRKRRRTAPEAHAKTETRETRITSSAVVAESDAREVDGVRDEH
jgi:hypothetical protein